MLKLFQKNLIPTVKAQEEEELVDPQQVLRVIITFFIVSFNTIK